MRKLISVAVVLILCVSLACPIFAAEEFVPSISYKGTPEVVTTTDADGREILAVIRNATGAVVNNIYKECLVLTPVSEANESEKIPADAKEELLSVYAALNNGSMVLPYGSNVKADAMVIRDLFDASWICDHDHNAMLEGEGTVIELTFDLGIEKDMPVVVMTYKNETWGEIAGVKNNGDGTITCTFEHLCPISISVQSKSTGAPDDAGDVRIGNVQLWVTLMAVSAVAMVAVVATRRKVR